MLAYHQRELRTPRRPKVSPIDSGYRECGTCTKQEPHPGEYFYYNKIFTLSEETPDFTQVFNHKKQVLLCNYHLCVLHHQFLSLLHLQTGKVHLHDYNMHRRYWCCCMV